MPTKEYVTVADLPSPKGAFITGHLKEFNVSNKHQVLERWAASCGDLYKINFVGKTFVVSVNNEINKEILKQRPETFRRFHKIQEILEEMGVYGVFNTEGDVWKRHRLITSEALNFKNIKGYFPVIKDITTKLLEKWSIAAKNNDIIDVQKEMMRYTVDITTKIAFGYEMNTLNHENDALQKHLERIFPMINTRITAPLPLWRVYKSKKDKALDESLKYLEKTIHKFIQEAKKRLENNPQLKEQPTNFLEALLVEQEQNSSFTDKEIYGNVFTMLLAGEDTTSNSISWAIYYLAQHPEIVSRIRNEAYEVLANSMLPETHDDIKLLKYTEATALEVLRIKPVTPNLYFEALEDVTVKHLFLKKGTTIMLQNKVAQTKEAHFSKPNDFLPERWLKNKCPMTFKNHKPNTIHTFGAGPRFCPGKNLAIQEMIMAISMLCVNFDIEMTTNVEAVKEVFTFTMYPDNLKVRLKHV